MRLETDSVEVKSDSNKLGNYSDSREKDGGTRLSRPTQGEITR